MGLNCHRHFCWTPLQSRLCVSLPGYGAHSKTASASFGWMTGNAISTVPLHATLQISHAQVWQLPQSVMWCSRPHARSSTCCVLLRSCHIGLEVEQSAELWGSNRRIPCKRMQKAIRHSPSTLWSQPCSTQAAAVSSFYEDPGRSRPRSTSLLLFTWLVSQSSLKSSQQASLCNRETSNMSRPLMYRGW